jgi:DNA invertase Pin-like site-specific DNA recombinase
MSLDEQERNRISETTKAGLQAARRRGKTLGNPHGLAKATRNSVAVRQKAAVLFAGTIAPLIRAFQQQGLSLRATAEALNRQGVPTYRGGDWRASQLCRMLALVRPQ